MSKKQKQRQAEPAAECYWFPHAEEGYVLGEVLHHERDRDVLSVGLQTPEGTTVAVGPSRALPCDAA